MTIPRTPAQRAAALSAQVGAHLRGVPPRGYDEADYADVVEP